jgi:predicted GTPase
MDDLTRQVTIHYEAAADVILMAILHRKAKGLLLMLVAIMSFAQLADTCCWQNLRERWLDRQLLFCVEQVDRDLDVFLVEDRKRFRKWDLDWRSGLDQRLTQLMDKSWIAMTAHFCREASRDLSKLLSRTRGMGLLFDAQ